MVANTSFTVRVGWGLYAVNHSPFPPPPLSVDGTSSTYKQELVTQMLQEVLEGDETTDTTVKHRSK